MIPAVEAQLEKQGVGGSSIIQGVCSVPPFPIEGDGEWPLNRESVVKTVDIDLFKNYIQSD